MCLLYAVLCVIIRSPFIITGDPFNCDNIVNQLQEGDIVTSIAPNRGPWICHDKGGWSISIYSAFRFLEPLDE